MCVIEHWNLNAAETCSPRKRLLGPEAVRWVQVSVPVRYIDFHISFDVIIAKLHFRILCVTFRTYHKIDLMSRSMFANISIHNQSRQTKNGQTDWIWDSSPSRPQPALKSSLWRAFPSMKKKTTNDQSRLSGRYCDIGQRLTTSEQRCRSQVLF